MGYGTERGTRRVTCTALIVPVPEGDPLVAEHRAAHDPSAALGVPAHITVLFPWIEVSDLAETARASLRSIVGDLAAFEFDLVTLPSFEDGTL